MIDNIDEYLTHLKQIRAAALPKEDVEFMEQCEANGDWHNKRYQDCVEVLNREYVDRRYPSPIQHLIPTMATAVYNAFQGDNEFVVTGKLKDFDLRGQLKNIQVPTLLTFGEHETMPLSSARRMAEDIPHSRLETTPSAGHHHMMDNPPVYFSHLKKFILDVENNRFPM
jgi:proline iminopeptidase